MFLNPASFCAERMYLVSSDFDSLYRRLSDTRKRQAEALADSDKQIFALDRLMGKTVQNDLVEELAKPPRK